MPAKIDSYSKPGQKVVSLFARLLFSQREYSLSELAQQLNCSKQTVSRLIENIAMAYGVEIEERIENKQKFFRLRVRQGNTVPALTLTASEMNMLFMCHAFAKHLLGNELLAEEATVALDKGLSQLSGLDRVVSPCHFAAFHSGTIDYTPHQETIRLLIDAMLRRKVCEIRYAAIMAEQEKVFHIKPLTIFSYQDTLYLYAKKAGSPGKIFKDPKFDPLLAIHRIKGINVTDITYEFPPNYDFAETFTQEFGVIKESSFVVKVEFSGFAAAYVSERLWSRDQKIEKLKDNKIRLTFMASSQIEVISWVLSWGNEARVISPKELVGQVQATIDQMQEVYAESKS